ncbi:hypothetical protein [Bifidobacterium stellenboschense]|uniref:Uncharacterized protein n=1 Tax=Bifidobacterium stellenboschense TaxID=762211 RepID=A0A087DJN6_9BIFI|nr:hypothetical protein [Bifidobacterium stellenboschense]KFI95736.1 hypothetical protein BSTEL_0542 [Bifidobacterium stellenboschense]
MADSENGRETPAMADNENDKKTLAMTDNENGDKEPITTDDEHVVVGALFRTTIRDFYSGKPVEVTARWVDPETTVVTGGRKERGRNGELLEEPIPVMIDDRHFIPGAFFRTTVENSYTGEPTDVIARWGSSEGSFMEMSDCKPVFFYVYEHEWGWIRRLVPLDEHGADTVSIEKVTDPDEIAVARKWLEPLVSEFTRGELEWRHADGILRVTNRVGFDLKTAVEQVGRIYSFPFSDMLLDALIDEYGATGSTMSSFVALWRAAAYVERNDGGNR